MPSTGMDTLTRALGKIQAAMCGAAEVTRPHACLLLMLMLTAVVA